MLSGLFFDLTSLASFHGHMCTLAGMQARNTRLTFMHVHTFTRARARAYARSIPSHHDHAGTGMRSIAHMHMDTNITQPGRCIFAPPPTPSTPALHHLQPHI